jgi:hypothetical protein
MDQSQARTAGHLSRATVGIFAAVASSVTLAWIAFLVWLGLRAFGLL